MKELVVPVGDPDDATRIAELVLARHRSEPARVHLLNVQRPLPKHISQFFSRADLSDFHHETGMRALEPVTSLLDRAGVPHEDHVVVGKPAESIVQFAESHGGAEIVLDEEPQGMLAVFGLGSIGSQVRRLLVRHHTADMPPVSSA
jgi:hypothetical protein